MQSLSRCVYCQAAEDLTDDHIPPKTLFAKPRPSTLITVPACRTCNSKASIDDEYFRYALTMSDATGINPKAAKGRESSLRSLARPRATRFKSRLLSSFRPVEVRSPHGVILGTRLGYQVELGRVFAVVSRIVRGLYYYETKRLLPIGSEVLVHCDDTLIALPVSELSEIVRTIITPLSHREAKVVEPESFSYRFQFFEEDPCVSVWALTFFSSISFLAISNRGSDS